MSDLPDSAEGEELSRIDVEFRFDQMALPDELPPEFDRLASQTSIAGLRSTVVVEPGSIERDFVTAPILLVVHFATAHGLDLAIATTGAAMWDAIKAVSRRLRADRAANSARARVLFEYRDGRAIEVDLEDDAKIIGVLKELRAGESATR